MRSALTGIIVCVLIAGCDSGSSNDALTIRNLETENDGELLYEITRNRPGEIRIEFGPEGMSMTVPTSLPPDSYLLRVISEELEGKTILDRYVSPLLGRDEADQLREQQPELEMHKLIYTTIEFAAADGSRRSSGSPIITRLPFAPAHVTHSRSMTSGLHGTNGARTQLAAWAYLPQQLIAGDGERSMSIGIAEDGVRLAVNGVPRDFEEAGGVYRQLTVELLEGEEASFASVSR